MNARPEPISFEPAVRERTSLLIAIAGATGSGKTRSALEIARGLCGGDDSKIGFIDTEAGRALHYAPTPTQMRSGAIPEGKFAFRHHQLGAPFTPERYQSAVEGADASGFEVIVIDSASHEWNGEGGLQDWHDQLVEASIEGSRQAALDRGWKFDEAKAAEKASIGSWKIPKMAHKRFVNRMLQSRAHLIFCLRAEEKLRMETVEEQGSNGKVFKKTLIIAPKDMPLPERWSPICEKNFMFEMTCSVVVTNERPGVPIHVKVNGEHQIAFPDDRPISTETGRILAEWARGDSAPAPRQQHSTAQGRPIANNGRADGVEQSEALKPSLAERVAKVEAALKDAKTSADKERAWRLASRVRQDLDQADPDRLVELEVFYEQEMAGVA